MMVQGAFTNQVAITPSDSAVFQATGALYVGVTGDVTVVPASRAAATTVLFKGVPAGTILPIAVTAVKATGTTATNIVTLR